SKCVTITVDRDLAEVPAALAAEGWTLAGARQLSLVYKPSTGAFGRILQSIQSAGLTLTDLSTEETDLEDIFLQLTR
ncbi:hypothetical protein ABTD48_19885, partial [Acinetobacter baumannii]